MHSRTVTVVLTEHMIETVYPAFLRSLSHLNNLEILQIVVAPWDQIQRLLTPTNHHRFPSVRTVALSQDGSLLLSAFPACKRLYLSQEGGNWWTINEVVIRVADWIPDIEEIYLHHGKHRLSPINYRETMACKHIQLPSSI